ncbi:MAG: transcriptional regulator [Nitrososphaerales archaeon]|nr:transcriptional regulator [Nitrososphaerales archaeon]
MSKLRTPCEVAVKYILPAFRSYVAKVLIKEYHLSQVAVAERLGITQAAISQYTSLKRGSKKMEQFEKIPLMKNMAKELVEGLANGKLSSKDSVLYFCKMCKTLRTRDVASILHKDLVVLPNECDICPELENL